MGSYDYLRMTMQGLANIVYNASQGNSVSKDDILDSLKRTIEDYNNKIDSKDNIEITDFRKR